MNWEYKVVEERLGKPQDTEDELNRMAKDGWEHYQISTLGPIPSRWLYFRRPLAGVGRNVSEGTGGGSGTGGR